ncbi:MAG: hypothetical protein ACK4MF_00715 [Hyphomicrobiaceae bacterium]
MSDTSANATAEAELEYRAIEQTLLETPRGRWFLAEHGRRARRLDMAVLEDAIGKLSSSLQQPPAVLGMMRLEIEKLSSFIAETRVELTARSMPKTEPGDKAALDGEATSPVMRMLQMAESIHELTWTLHEDELDPKSCEAIARNASMLYAVSRQQAMESERTLKFADALDDTTNRLTILLDTLLHELQSYSELPAAPPADEPDFIDEEPQRAAV